MNKSQYYTLRICESCSCVLPEANAGLSIVTLVAIIADVANTAVRKILREIFDVNIINFQLIDKEKRARREQKKAGDGSRTPQFSRKL